MPISEVMLGLLFFSLLLQYISIVLYGRRVFTCDHLTYSGCPNEYCEYRLIADPAMLFLICVNTPLPRQRDCLLESQKSHNCQLSHVEIHFCFLKTLNISRL